MYASLYLYEEHGTSSATPRYTVSRVLGEVLRVYSVNKDTETVVLVGRFSPAVSVFALKRGKYPFWRPCFFLYSLQTLSETAADVVKIICYRSLVICTTTLSLSGGVGERDKN